MVPLALFKSRTFAGANLITFFLYSGLGGILYGVVQLRVTRTAPDEVALVDNGSPFFQSWCVHESIRWRGSKAAWE
jgi:hypothetical protein